MLPEYMGQPIANMVLIITMFTALMHAPRLSIKTTG